MGHYASEIGYQSKDPFDYKAVNALGFESVLGASFSSVHLKSCPRCFALVLGEHAEEHWWSQHQKVVYNTYSKIGTMWYVQSLTEIEEVAAAYASEDADEIVYAQVVDR